MSLLTAEYLVVAGGGAVGSMLRFGLSRWIQGHIPNNFPWGILTCNVLGSLVIGILYGILVERYGVGPLWRAAILIGLLGGFTTFSSFSLDSITLMMGGYFMRSLLYIILTLLGCLLAAALGIAMVKVTIPA